MTMNISRRDFSIALGVAVCGAVTGDLRGEKSRPMRVGVIGHTGRGDYGHGLHTMWLNVPGVEIAAVADPVAAGLARALDQLGRGQGFDDYRRMLAEVKPDLVAIGMRHIDQHCEVALAAVNAGVRGIYMEKPFCRTLAEADQIVGACEERNVKLALAHRNRYHPVLPLIAKLVREGAIGQLLEMRARGKEDARGGLQDLWVLGSHILNLIHFLGGAPLACSATVLQEGTPVGLDEVKQGGEAVGPIAGNELHARFELESGVPAFFDSVRNAGHAAAGFGVQLVGTKGIIDLRMDQEPLAHLMEGSPFEPAREPRAWIPITTGGVGMAEPVSDLRRDVMGHVTAALDLMAAIHEDREPLCGARDGRVTIEMIQAVYESHRLQGQRVTLPLASRTHPWERRG
jgi:predicted dehydrogenase